MPNSIIQGLTTKTAAELNRLGAFATTVLLGLLTKVDPKHPEREVRMRPSEVLEIIEVGRSVAHAVEREWDTKDGPRRKRYAAKRHNPKLMRQLHEALLTLHGQTVAVQRWDAAGRTKREDLAVHILDMFGYCYTENGREIDVDALPVGKVKVNVASEERPVWRVRRRTVSGEQNERPAGILFRLNKELAAELVARKGTIGFTRLYRRVFGVLREFHREPTAVRLLLLVLRQTGQTFVRGLDKMLEELGWDCEHKARSLARLKEVLKRLIELQIIVCFEVDEQADRFELTWNKGWDQEVPEVATSG